MLLSSRRWIACSALVWLGALHAQGAWAQDSEARSVAIADKREVKQLLLRIQDAAKKRSYQGTVIVSNGTSVVSSRIVHHGDSRTLFERIDSLDGQPRHVVRQHDTVHTVWPSRKVAMVEQSGALSSFPRLLQPGSDQVPEFYELHDLGEERVAGRDARVLDLRPKDSLRYGQRLWSDKETGLLLRSEVINDTGTVLESSAFSDVDLNVQTKLDNILKPIRKMEGYRMVHSVSSVTKLDAEGWRIKKSLPGFQLVSCVRRVLDAPLKAPEDAAAPEASMIQAVLSDGLTHVSLFIEPFQPQRHLRPIRASIGATQTLIQRQGDFWLTLMGDVPAPTLQRLVDSLERLPS